MSGPKSPSVAKEDCGWNLDNSYARLPELFYVKTEPSGSSSPQVVIFNRRLAEELGLSLDALSEEELAQLFSGQVLPPGAEPLAQAYCGHQFGGFTMLGDGRAHLIGEQITPDGRRFDLQFKGSGRTPFSRGGDGKAALGPMLREYIISEAMHGLGIPTTRSLAVVATGDPVDRERELPGAILTRVAASHLRVGTFQYAAARRDEQALRQLADYAIQRHCPEVAEAAEPYREFFRWVVQRQAQLIAQWQSVGFIHGVMNTDNMAISGETIDYGPCAFMDAYHENTVFSSIDTSGRYAYGNQPSIGHWNLARFAESLLYLFDADQERAVEIGTEEVNRFGALFEVAWQDIMRKKLGLVEKRDEDRELVDQLLSWMQANKADFTKTFRQLGQPTQSFESSCEESTFASWLSLWQQRVDSEGATIDEATERIVKVNPLVIARNFQVERALEAATEDGDLQPTVDLLRALANPFESHSSLSHLEEEPPADFGPYRTFCGT